MYKCIFVMPVTGFSVCVIDALIVLSIRLLLINSTINEFFYKSLSWFNTYETLGPHTNYLIKFLGSQKAYTLVRSH